MTTTAATPSPAAAPPAPLTDMRVIRRAELPEIRTVEIDGQRHNLGILKDFRKHAALASFVPEQGRPSFAWVHLDAGELLAPHVHPTPSMIIVAHGAGEVLGDLQASITDGDIVAIPAGRLHGFRGAGTDGLWALSIQFEGLGLYEDPERARVRFADGAPDPRFQELMARNVRFAQEFVEQNPLHKLLDSGALTDPSRRSRFFEAVKVFSRYFQRALFARSAAADEARYSALYRVHLDEEYGHDERLSAEVGRAPETLWDPTLEAVSNWFVWKMLTLDNAEKVVLMSLVLEVSSDLFSKHGKTVLPGLNYFDVHAVADEAHQEAGLPLLHHLDGPTYDRLFEVQRQGWSMLNLMASRLAGSDHGQ